MFCKACGNEISDEARFCPNCGNVMQGDDDTSVIPAQDDRTGYVGPAFVSVDAQKVALEDGAQQDAGVGGVALGPVSAQSGHNKNRKPLLVALIGAAAAIAVFTAFIAIGVLGRGAVGGVVVASEVTSEQDSIDRIVAYYGSADAVEASQTTKIIPSSSQDSPLQHYYVRILDAVDEGGETIDTLDSPRLEVQTQDGFCIEDFYDNSLDVKSGTYYMVVTDDDENDKALPPISVGDASGGSGGGSVSDDAQDEWPIVAVPEGEGGSDTPASIASVRQGPYAAFYDVLNDIVSAQGVPDVKTTSTSSNSWTAWSQGLCFAELIDFGDGELRLVTVYCTVKSSDAKKDSSSLMKDGAYVLQVWEYDSDSDSAKKVYGSTDFYMGPNESGINLTICEASKSSSGSSDVGEGFKYIRVKTTGKKYTGGYEYEYYGIADDGEFGKAGECGCSDSSGAGECYAGDETCDYASFEAYMKKMESEMRRYSFYNSRKSSQSEALGETLSGVTGSYDAGPGYCENEAEELIAQLKSKAENAEGSGGTKVIGSNTTGTVPGPNGTGSSASTVSTAASALISTGTASTAANTNDAAMAAYEQVLDEY